MQVSIRAWLALMIVGTVCAISMIGALHALKQEGELSIQEPLYSMVLLTLGFFFGQKSAPKITS